MIHDERLEKRRCHRRQILVVAGLGAEQSAFQQAGVWDTRRTAEALDEPLVNREHRTKKDCAQVGQFGSNGGLKGTPDPLDPFESFGVVRRSSV